MEIRFIPGDIVYVTESFMQSHNQVYALKKGHAFKVSKVDESHFPVRLVELHSDEYVAWVHRENLDKLSKKSIGDLSQDPGLQKYSVFRRKDVPAQLWERNGTIEVRFRGRVKKTFTVPGNVDQWAEAFFDGYSLAA